MREAVHDDTPAHEPSEDRNEPWQRVPPHRRRGSVKLGLRDRYFRRNRTTHTAYRAAVGAIGGLVVLVGVALIPLPGPGWLIVFTGLAILGSEFRWAKRLLRFATTKVTAWTHWVARQSFLVRAGIGLGCLALVAGAVLLYLGAAGVPGWAPESVASWLTSWVPSIR